jgi:hypothetical protein
MGGLSRRATILEQTRATNTTFVVDAGDLTWKSEVLEESRRAQQREKAQLQFDVYSDGGIDAMVPGEADLTLGVEWLAAEAKSRSLPYVASNLKCPGWVLPPGRVVERNGIRVAFIGVVGPPNGGPCAVSSTIPAVAAAVDALGEADVHVLLSHQSIEEDEAIVRSVAEIDVVVNGHGRNQYSRPVLIGGHAIQLAPGTRGKKLGIAEFQLFPGAQGLEVMDSDADLEKQIETLRGRRDRAKERMVAVANDRSRLRAAQRLERLEGELTTAQSKLASSQKAGDTIRNQVSNHLAPLSESVAEHRAVQARVDVFKARMEKTQTAVPRTARVTADRPFVGDRACAGCHAEQHAQWKSTAHAYAWSTLVQENRSQDLDCWTCHVTGAHHPDGPKHPQEVAGLHNVGCESCHGPGKKHVAGPSTGNIIRSPSLQACEQCHDGVKDEGRFEFEPYLKKVTH